MPVAALLDTTINRLTTSGYLAPAAAYILRGVALPFISLSKTFTYPLTFTDHPFKLGMVKSVESLGVTATPLTLGEICCVLIAIEIAHITSRVNNITLATKKGRHLCAVPYC